MRGTELDTGRAPSGQAGRSSTGAAKASPPSGDHPSRKGWLARLFGIQEKTRVYLRSMEAPAEHWDSVVRYDAWGSPYALCSDDYLEVVLHKDGTTSDTWLDGTEWRHKSGPPVAFPTNKPKSPFAKARGEQVSAQ